MGRSEATEQDLVMFEGAHFHDLAFSWRDSVGVTDIEFLVSDKLGEKYENNFFVGDINSGNLYYFELNEQIDVLGRQDIQDSQRLITFLTL